MTPASLGVGLLLLAALPVGASSGDRAGDGLPRELRFARDVQLPARTAEGDLHAVGCAVLDGMVYAHAGSGDLADLRLYAAVGDRWVDLPLLLRKSGTERVDDDPAPVWRLTERNGEIGFDLRMPERLYTAVRLDLAARDFVGTAEVWGEGREGQRRALGSFTVFDLSGAKLSRSTVLALQEAGYSELHIALRLRAAPGTPQRRFPASVVRGASVPPSREAQTLYTPVAETRRFVQRGGDTIATLHVGAHTPVERVAVGLRPEYRQSFLRQVTVTATPDGTRDSSMVESLRGEISQVHSVAGGAQEEPGGPEATAAGSQPTEAAVAAGSQAAVHGAGLIDDHKMQFPAVLGANLREGATVEVYVANGTAAPLPLESVQLLMRQLQVCFPIVAGATGYQLLYGGRALPASASAGVALPVQVAAPTVAVLGPERLNGGYAPAARRPAWQSLRARLLLGLFALGLATMAGAAMHGARQGSGRSSR